VGVTQEAVKSQDMSPYVCLTGGGVEVFAGKGEDVVEVGVGRGWFH